MATITKYRNKFKVSIRRKFHKSIYKTFSRYDDAKSWAFDSERKLEKGFYEDLTEANKTYVKITFCQYKTSPSGWILWHKPFTVSVFLDKKEQEDWMESFQKIEELLDQPLREWDE